MKFFNIEKICETEAEIREGLQFVTDFPSNGCCLFKFRSPRRLHFWGKDTFLPLAVLFIDENYQIESIGKVNPMDETPVSSKGACIMAVEVKYGAASRGIKPGMRVQVRSGMVVVGS